MHLLVCLRCRLLIEGSAGHHVGDTHGSYCHVGLRRCCCGPKKLISSSVSQVILLAENLLRIGIKRQNCKTKQKIELTFLADGGCFN